MSGPVVVPAGWAEKANHCPSALYAAWSPARVTLLRIARVAAAVGAGVPEGGVLTIGVADGAAGVVLGDRVGAADGELAGADGGAELVRAVGLTLGTGVSTGGTLAGADELGAALEAATGTAITKSVVPSLSGAGPIATAWAAFEGERTSELGTGGRLAMLCDRPARGAQSGSSPVGQTLS